MRFYTTEDTGKFERVTFLLIKTRIEDHVFHITLNRPEKRNAFTPTMAEEIIYAIAYAHYNPSIRCVILSAEGPVFCAGADLASFHDSSLNIKNETLPRIREEARLGDAFKELYKPAIAQVEGPVFAGGFLLTCGCTFVISNDSATFALPEVKRGIWPMQVMASLRPILSTRKMLEMALTGRNYSAMEALEMELVTEIVESGDVKKRALELAAQICKNAPFAIQAGMKALDNLSGIPENQHHSYLKEQLDLLLQSEDAKEGTTAFKEKRNPVWKGR